MTIISHIRKEKFARERKRAGKSNSFVVKDSPERNEESTRIVRCNQSPRECGKIAVTTNRSYTPLTAVNAVLYFR